MTGTIEVKIRVFLQDEISGDSQTVRDVVQAVLNGELHPLIENTELIEFSTEDEGYCSSLTEGLG